VLVDVGHRVALAARTLPRAVLVVVRRLPSAGGAGGDGHVVVVPGWSRNEKECLIDVELGMYSMN